MAPVRHPPVMNARFAVRIKRRGKVRTSSTPAGWFSEVASGCEQNAMEQFPDPRLPAESVPMVGPDPSGEPERTGTAVQ